MLLTQYNDRKKIAYHDFVFLVVALCCIFRVFIRITFLYFKMLFKIFFNLYITKMMSNKKQCGTMKLELRKHPVLIILATAEFTFRY